MSWHITSGNYVDGDVTCIRSATAKTLSAAGCASQGAMQLLAPGGHAGGRAQGEALLQSEGAAAGAGAAGPAILQSVPGGPQGAAPSLPAASSLASFPVSRTIVYGRVDACSAVTAAWHRTALRFIAVEYYILQQTTSRMTDAPLVLEPARCSSRSRRCTRQRT